MPIQVLPNPADVQLLLNSLLGRDITVAKEAPESIPLDKKIVVGLYERENGKVGGLVIADLEIACYAGAALSLMPIGIAKESIDAGDIEDVLLENFQEVLNVGVSWFTGKMNPRVVLSDVYPPGAALANDIKQTMATPADRLELSVEIAGYGAGRMRFHVNEY